MIAPQNNILVDVEPTDDRRIAAGQNVGNIERVGSVALGAFLIASAVRRRSWVGLVSALVGISLVNRGVTGRCSVYKTLDINTARTMPRQEKTSVYGSVTIQRTASQLYDLWRDPENFPRFFEHFAQIHVTSTESSHWEVKAPFGRRFQWDAWITEERRGELIAWQSSDDAQLPNQGLLRFRPAPGDRGTEVILELHFTPPGGRFGKKVADLFGIVPRSMAQQALRRFKSLVEAGEIPRLDPQPAHRRNEGGLYESPMLERS